jgi:hypothetical protein
VLTDLQVLEVDLVQLGGRGDVEVHSVGAPRRTLSLQLLCKSGIQSGVGRRGEPVLEGVAVRHTHAVRAFKMKNTIIHQFNLTLREGQIFIDHWNQ